MWGFEIDDTYFGVRRTRKIRHCAAPCFWLAKMTQKSVRNVHKRALRQDTGRFDNSYTGESRRFGTGTIPQSELICTRQKTQCKCHRMSL